MVHNHRFFICYFYIENQIQRMAPLIKEDFFPIGYIAKPHGLRGEVTIETEEGFEDVLVKSDYLLVEIEGGLVPFFISKDGINFRTPTSISLAFDDLDSADKVRPFCGSRIFLSNDATREQVVDEQLNELIGFTVFDLERGKLGEIIWIDDFSGNVVLTIQHGSHEILIPLSDDLITKLDEEKKELHLECPEGLIDLYLE